MNNLLFMPILTSQAGSCLTVENLQDVGATTASFQLESLLHKPGIEYLKSLGILSKFTGWHGRFFLNAILPKPNRNGVYLLRSPFDGVITQLSLSELLAVCVQLQPDCLILPVEAGSDCLSLFPDGIKLYINADNYSDDNWSGEQGVYFTQDNVSKYYAGEFDHYKGAIHIVGEVDQHFDHRQLVSYESDIPASDACRGKVYSNGVNLSLDEVNYAKQFKVIDEYCKCQTCEQQLTRAYLHHLLLHTPLLCQRFLIQHNIYTCLVN